MKTCKDCIYYEADYLVEGEWDDEIGRTGICHLYPIMSEVSDNHWCGQLKEKVHVISDFPSLDKS